MSEDQKFTEIARDLKALFHEELQVAAAQSDHPRSRRRVRATADLPIAMVFVAVITIAAIVVAREVLLSPVMPSPGNNAHAQATLEGNQYGSTGPTPSGDSRSSDLPSSSPTVQPSAMGQPSSNGGFPAEIGGQQVLVSGEVLERAMSGSLDPFLAGGWVAFVIADCYDPADCPSGFVLQLDLPGRAGGQVVHLELPSRLIDLHDGKPVVLKVSRAAGSPQCAPEGGCAARVLVHEVVWVGV